MLVLLVGAARSGTTLLRLILDAHSQIGCPAEAAIPALVANLCHVWSMIDPDGLQRPPVEADDRADPSPPRLPAAARAAVAEAVSAPMRYYCEREVKRIYCDKSLDSVHYLAAVHEVFPQTRSILLFRHVMDTVASGLEASPWGFASFGYLPFVQRSPENLVAALVSYWVGHVDGALRWEAKHPDLCHRVRYEDLVGDPCAALERIFGFLGVPHEPQALERAFAHARTATGPGDQKVRFTSAVERASVGGGRRVPIEMVPPPLLADANEKLEALGYARLDRSWNAEPSERGGASGAANGAARLATLVDGVQPVAVADDADVVSSFALVADDARDLRWVVDLAEGTVRHGDGEVECVITGSATDLARMLAREVNPAVLLRSGRIRHLGAREAEQGTDPVRALRVIVDALAIAPEHGHGRRQRRQDGSSGRGSR